jgi:hypothetical protein
MNKIPKTVAAKWKAEDEKFNRETVGVALWLSLFQLVSVTVKIAAVVLLARFIWVSL